MRWATSRIARLLFGALLPAPFGVVLITAPALLMNLLQGAAFDAYVFRGITAVMLMAYGLIGIQSILFSLLMEFVVNPRSSNTRRAVNGAALIGGASGAVPVLFGFILNPGLLDSIAHALLALLSAALAAFLGAVVGRVMGRVLRGMYVAHA